MTASNRVYGLTADGLPRDALTERDVIDLPWDEPPTGAPWHALPDCDVCGHKIAEDDHAPACGSHRLHVVCQPEFECRECYRVWDEDVRP